MVLKRLVVIMFLLSITLFAEVEDKWKVSVGGMKVLNFETDMQIGNKDIPLGAKINTADQLGLETDTMVFRFDGYYRFNEKHSVEASYFSVKSDVHRESSNDIVWDDYDISAGSNVDIYFNMDIFKVNYGYSFYHNDDIELMLTAGLHITRIDLGLSAQGTINGEDGDITSVGADVTAPLPMVGFKGEYTIFPKELFITYKANIFYLAFSDYVGSLISSNLNLEYRVTEHIGLGLGLDSNVIYVESDDGDNKLEVENRLTGLMFFMSYVY